MTQPKSNLSLFLLLACLWSGSFVAIKANIAIWPPLFSAALRVGIAWLCIFIFMLISKRKTTVNFALRWRIWLIGLFAQGIPFALLFWGEHFISAGLAGILNATVSIWTFLLALIFMPGLTQFCLRKVIGLSVGILGVGIIFGPLLVFNENLPTVLGAMAVLLMAISYAISALLNQYFLKSATPIDFFANLYHQLYASLVFLVLVAVFSGQLPHYAQLVASGIAWLASLYLGIFSTALAFIIYYHLIREWDAIRASAVMYLMPALALLWDFLFYATRPRLSEIIGVIIILMGVVLIQLSNPKPVSQLNISAS